MDLDDAIRHLDAYLDAEWALTRAVYSEPDDEAVRALRQEVDSFVHEDWAGMLGILPSRMPGMAAEEVAARTRSLDQQQRRRLFLVAQHDNPLWGALFGGIAGYQATLTAGSYERLFYVAPTEAGPRIVSHYDADPLAEDVAWLHTGGVVVDNPGPVVAVRALDEPARAPHREHWAAMTEAAR